MGYKLDGMPWWPCGCRAQIKSHRSVHPTPPHPTKTQAGLKTERQQKREQAIPKRRYALKA